MPPEPRQVVPLPTKTVLNEDWTLPDAYRQWAAEHRPDLRDRLDTIAEGFRDFHLSKATRSASWIAEWRRWVNRERAVKQQQKAPAAPRTQSRFPQAEAPEDPVAAAQAAERERAYREFWEARKG